MRIELSKDLKFGFIYTKHNENLSKTNQYDIISIEKISNMMVYKMSSTSKVEAISFQFDLSALFEKYKCNICNKNIILKHIARLPEEEWAEKIDLWSCHEMMFKSMTFLEMKPRKNGILLSSFYFIFNNIMKCQCKSLLNGSIINKKIFYNEIFDEKICLKIIYLFFKEHFRHNNSFSFNKDKVCYNIKFLDTVFTYKKQKNPYIETLKVGYSTSDKLVRQPKGINNYFINAIVNILVENYAGIEIQRMRISFIDSIII